LKNKKTNDALAITLITLLISMIQQTCGKDGMGYHPNIRYSCHLAGAFFS
jgi:hypothetical protein